MKTVDLIDLSKAVAKSKKLKRTGWLREGIKNSESVADHSFRLIVFSMVLAPYFKVDQDKLIKMAIIHDLGETKTGDLVSERGKKRNDDFRAKKEMLEDQAIVEILGKFGKQYHKVFHEMIERKTKEAKLFWQLDKLEMAVQAKEYEREQNLEASEFIENAKMHIKEPRLLKILDAILNT